MTDLLSQEEHGERVMGDKGLAFKIYKPQAKFDNLKSILPSLASIVSTANNERLEQSWFMSSTIKVDEVYCSFPPPRSPYEPCERKGRIDFFFDGLDPHKDGLLRNAKKRPRHGNWMCAFCYQWTETKEELVVHMKTIHEKTARFHVCKTCGSRFATKFLLERHRGTHKYQPIYPHINYVDSRGVPMKELMADHYLCGVKPGRPTQDTLSDALDTFKRLSSTPTFPCMDCDKEYVTFEEAEEHYADHHATIICKLCKDKKSTETYHHFSDLKTHLQEVHSLNSLEYYFDGYAKVWNWIEADQRFNVTRRSVVKFFHPYAKSMSKMPWVSLKQLQLAARQAKLDVVTNDEATFDTPYVNNLDARVEVEEIRDLNLSGGDVATNSCTENEEQKVEDEVPETITKEEEAERGTLTNRSRKKGVPRRPCYVCKKLITYTAFEHHMEAHVAELKFACTLAGCTKRFLTQNSLVLHSRAHCVDRIHKCPHCSRAYNYSSLLKRHMRIHTGEMPYECDMCGKKFHELVSLNYHRMKIHTGERPHRCNLCERAFILASDLKKHMVMHNRVSNVINLTQKDVDIDLDMVAGKIGLILSKAKNGKRNRISKEERMDGLSTIDEEGEDEIQCEVVTVDMSHSSAL